MSNPFHPSFGKRPNLFLGRQDISRSILSAVNEENSPWRTTLITGIRGSGKTALLSEIRNNLDATDVIVLYIVPNEAILDSVLVQLYRQLPKTIAETLPELKTISVNLGLSVGFEKDKSTPYFTETFTYQIMEPLDAYMKQNKHVVFLIDEAQKHTEDIRIFISTYQDLVMREYSVSMVLAGLPSVVTDILNDDILTFLRRAKHIELENIELMTVRRSFKKVFLNEPVNLSEELVTKAAEATYGYPYLIQLVGYYLWEKMCDNNDFEMLEDALFDAKVELFRNVHKLVFADLSNRDREFVFAMSEDKGFSSVSDIAERMQKKKNFISLYRERLISGGVVKPAGHGLLCFSYPYMREFLINKKLEIGL